MAQCTCYLLVQHEAHKQQLTVTGKAKLVNLIRPRILLELKNTKTAIIIVTLRKTYDPLIYWRYFVHSEIKS